MPLVRLFDILRLQWKSLNSAQRLVLMSMVAALAISIAVFFLWVRKPDMAVLASNVDYRSAGEVIKMLDEKGIRYRVTDGGRTILVPRAALGELRILLAASLDVSSSQAGYELFDNEKIGITEFAQKINLQRALEGELGRTISSLKAVEKARVHIAIPKESVFIDEASEPTASVVVALRPGGRLSPAQVRGIANLVSFSVEGLKSENVSIVDDEGNVLQGEESPLTGVTSAQIEEQKAAEAYLARKIEGLLADVVGRGKVKAAVNVELNWEQVERTREEYDPENAAVRSEERNESSSTNEGSTSESIVTNYEINKTIEHVLSAVGTVKHLSVAVFVDDVPVTDEQGNVTWRKRTDEELQQLEQVVKNAVGFDAGRGDRVSVVNMHFSPRGSAGEGGDFFSSPMFQLLPSLLSKLAAMSIALFLFLALRKKMSQTPRVAAGIPGTAGETVEVIPEFAAGVDVEGKVKKIAASSPENVAKLVKTWMVDQGENT